MRFSGVGPGRGFVLYPHSLAHPAFEDTGFADHLQFHARPRGEAEVAGKKPEAGPLR